VSTLRVNDAPDASGTEAESCPARRVASSFLVNDHAKAQRKKRKHGWNNPKERPRI
jgi:hypothetical protein